jgi:hypothetical protein
MEGQGTGISKHLGDDLLMGEVLDEKNTFGALQEIMGEIHKLANNKERRETAFHGLHYLHQTLLELVQRGHSKGPTGTGGMNSLSDATSGNKHRNRRKKRANDKIRDDKKRPKVDK